MYPLYNIIHHSKLLSDDDNKNIGKDICNALPRFVGRDGIGSRNEVLQSNGAGAWWCSN